MRARSSARQPANSVCAVEARRFTEGINRFLCCVSEQYCHLTPIPLIALHETRLSESANLADPVFMQALDRLTRDFEAAGHAASQAHAMALAALSQTLQQQATFMAALDGFLVLALIASVAAVYAGLCKALD